MGTLIILLIVGVLVWAVKSGIQQGKVLRDLQNEFAARHAGWDIYTSAIDKTLIALEHDKRLVVLGSLNHHSQYPWSAIVSVDVMKNGGSLTQTNRGSQLVGGAVGGILLGPVGLLAGAVTGSKRASETIEEIGLRVIVDDRLKPSHTVTFLKVSGSGLKASNPLAKMAIERVDHFYALLANAMRHCAQKNAAQGSLPSASAADQIAKLWSLKEAGALSEEEFRSQKALLLDRSNLPSNEVP